MRPIRLRVIFVIALIIWVALMAFVIYDVPRVEEHPAPVVIYVNEPPPYPEEDTMHYITKEGVLIIYAGSQETP